MTVTNSEIGAFTTAQSDIGTPDTSDELLIYDVSATATKKVLVSALASAGSAPAFVGATVKHASSQNLNNNSETTLAFDSEDIDSDAFHDTVTNNSRLTVPSGKNGKYVATAVIAFTNSTNGTVRSVRIYKNGTSLVAMEQRAEALGAGAAEVVGVTTPVLALVATDYLEVRVFVDGASLQALASADYSPRFSLYRVGT